MLPAPAHEPLLTAQAVYRSKQEKLDCMPQGYVRDSRQIRVWNDYVHQAVSPEVKERPT